jgi:hypothetical protein
LNRLILENISFNDLFSWLCMKYSLSYVVSICIRIREKRGKNKVFGMIIKQNGKLKLNLFFVVGFYKLQQWWWTVKGKLSCRNFGSKFTYIFRYLRYSHVSIGRFHKNCEFLSCFSACRHLNTEFVESLYNFVIVLVHTTHADSIIRWKQNVKVFFSCIFILFQHKWASFSHFYIEKFQINTVLLRISNMQISICSQ